MYWCVCVFLCFYLLGSCHLQYFRGNVLTKFDQGMNRTIEVRGYSIWASQPGAQNPFPRRMANIKEEMGLIRGGGEEERVHLLTTEATKGCGIILSNKYWFRGNKRTWQKLTASSMALTLLSLIGHSIRLLRTPRIEVTVYCAVWILKFMD